MDHGLSWNGKPNQSMSFGFPIISYRASSITRPRPPRIKAYRDPRESNLMTYHQTNKFAKANLLKKIAEVPRRRFFTKNDEDNADPELLNLNHRRPPPFSHLRRPVPPAFPLTIFDLNRLYDEASPTPSDLSLIPKRPSLINEFTDEDRYDADRLDAERKGAFLSRRTAKTRINVEAIKAENKKIVVPLAQQVRHWETHLRDKTSVEKLKLRTAQMVGKEKLDESRTKARHSQPRILTPPKPIYAGDDDLVRRLIMQSKKDEERAKREMSTYFRIPPAFDLPRNATTKKAEEVVMELITPYNLYDILSRDKQKENAEKLKNKSKQNQLRKSKQLPKKFP